MKKVFAFSFFVLGISSLVSQVVIIRELMMSFYGNEFFIGWVLCAWLLWTACGSFIPEKFFKRESGGLGWAVICHLLVAVLLPAVIVLIRASKMMTGSFPGQVPNLVPALILAFFAAAPYCFILGVQFSVANRSQFFLDSKSGAGPLVARSYFYETLGFVAGGILFSYFLIGINEFRVASVLAAWNLTSAACLGCLARPLKKGLFFTLLLTAVLCANVFTRAEAIQHKTSGLRFPSEVLVESVNSVHGNISVTRTQGQYNFYQSGLLLGPGENDLFNEYLVHFPMLLHAAPEKILLIGTGFNGALREILKYDPQTVDYVEFDPRMIETAARYISPDLARLLKDRRVRIFSGDSRLFLKTTRETFDVVILNLPNPSTALINRCYTEEFFDQLKTHLRRGGILATHLAFSPNILTTELGNLGASVYRTFKKSFPSVLVLPEDTAFFIGSAENILSADPAPLIEKLKKRGIENHFVVAPYIEYRLTNDRVANIQKAFETNREAALNRDLVPRGYFYNLVYWLSYFYRGLAGVFAWLGRVPWAAVFFAMVLAVSLPAVFLKGKSPGKKRLYFLAMACGGFSLMAAEVMMIYAFQVFYGNLYYKIAWIITSFMAGMGLGARLGAGGSEDAHPDGLGRLHLLMAGYFLAGVFLIAGISGLKFWLPAWAEWVFFGLAVFIGALVGFEFSYANRLFFYEAGKVPSGLGVIYTADLLGSCLGALGVSVFMIPVYGLLKTFFLLIGLNLVISALLFFAKNLRGKNE